MAGRTAVTNIPESHVDSNSNDFGIWLAPPARSVAAGTWRLKRELGACQPCRSRVQSQGWGAEERGLFQGPVKRDEGSRNDAKGCPGLRRFLSGRVYLGIKPMAFLHMTSRS